ncbi:MAG TPA: hypothetical protein VF941_05960 [Clostridia bacterium]
MKKIYASFNNMTDARNALEGLRENGVGSACIDAYDDFRTEFSSEISSNFPVLDLTTVALKSASTHGNGSFRHGGFATNFQCVLVVHAEENDTDTCKEVIGRFGGDVQMMS